MTEQLPEMLSVARADLEEIAIVAGDVMDFEDLGDAGQFNGRRHVGAVLGAPDGNEREHASIDDVRVDQRYVIPDNALGFELSQPLEDGRWRQTNGFGELGLCGSSVVLKDIQ